VLGVFLRQRLDDGAALRLALLLHLNGEVNAVAAAGQFPQGAVVIAEIREVPRDEKKRHAVRLFPSARPHRRRG
jgi:hypothetical protein